MESFHELPTFRTPASCLNRATLQNLRTPTLEGRQLQGVHELDSATKATFKVPLYEYLLSQLAASGTNGQFSGTPRTIIEYDRRDCRSAARTTALLI